MDLLTCPADHLRDKIRRILDILDGTDAEESVTVLGDVLGTWCPAVCPDEPLECLRAIVRTADDVILDCGVDNDPCVVCGEESDVNLTMFDVTMHLCEGCMGRVVDGDLDAHKAIAQYVTGKRSKGANQ